MYDIKDLEAEWLKYRKKKRKPFILAFVFTIFSGLFFYFLYKNFFLITKEDRKPKITKNITIKPTITHIPKAQVNKKVLVSPKVTVKKISKIPVLENKKKNIVHHPKKKKIRKKVHQPKIIKRAHINIIQTSSTQAYKDVERRFSKFPDTDDSLFLARLYYKKELYNKAEYWALKTNKINNNIEESWLIFAKAKAKQGYRKDAIRILRHYIEQSNSLEAKHLLRKLKR